MADEPIVHIGENSPEQVAYKMMRDILTSIEGRSLRDTTRAEYLQTYLQCRNAVLTGTL